MKILMELEVNNKKEANLKYSFMNQLVKDLKIRLYNNLDDKFDEDKLERLEEVLLKSEILWKTKQKPKELNVRKILIAIINNIKWYELENNQFIVQINRMAKLENSNTSLESIAKLIDYGAPNFLPTRFFSKYFQEFRAEALHLWSTYKQFNTKIKVKRLVTVR